MIMTNLFSNTFSMPQTQEQIRYFFFVIQNLCTLFAMVFPKFSTENDFLRLFQLVFHSPPCCNSDVLLTFASVTSHDIIEWVDYRSLYQSKWRGHIPNSQNSLISDFGLASLSPTKILFTKSPTFPKL